MSTVHSFSLSLSAEFNSRETVRPLSFYPTLSLSPLKVRFGCTVRDCILGTAHLIHGWPGKTYFFSVSCLVPISVTEIKLR